MIAVLSDPRSRLRSITMAKKRPTASLPVVTRRRFLEQLGAVGGSSLIMTAMTSLDLMAGQAGVRPALTGREATEPRIWRT